MIAEIFSNHESKILVRTVNNRYMLARGLVTLNQPSGFRGILYEKGPRGWIGAHHIAPVALLVFRSAFAERGQARIRY